MKNRVQEAVDVGELTEEQGAELEKRSSSEQRRFWAASGGSAASAAIEAETLGLTEGVLREQLRDGKTLAGVAKAEGKPRRQSRSGHGE